MAIHYINASITAEETSDAKAIKEMAVCTRESEVTRSRPRCLKEGFNVFTFRSISLYWMVCDCFNGALKKILQYLISASARKPKELHFYDSFLTKCQGNNGILFQRGINWHLSHLENMHTVHCSHYLQQCIFSGEDLFDIRTEE